MMEPLFYGLLFLFVFSFVLFFILGIEGWVKEQWRKNLGKVADSTDFLFLSLSDKIVLRTIILSTTLFGIMGFFLPGQLEILDRFSIDSAVELNNQGKHNEALDVLIDYIEMDSPIVQNELGVAYLGLGALEEAEKRFGVSISMQPDYVAPHANLAVAYSLLGKEQDAKFELRKAKSLAIYPIDNELIYGIDSGIFEKFYLRIFFALCFALIGWLVPKVVLKWMINKRRQQFDELLPEGLIMATNGLRAGMSLGQVLESLSKEAPKPLNQEFGLVVKEQRLGKDFNESLRGLARRMATDDTHILVNSITILREVGGNLTEVFENLSFTIRERKMIKEKISTMTAEGRSQAVILVILPFVMGWLLDKISPEVFSLMYTTPLGWLIILFMFIWGGIGCFAMWKIVQIKI